jgi:acyl carrier protein
MGSRRKSYAPPQGEIENQLALTWSELPNVDCIGRHDDFFALGGRSLMVARLLNRIEAEFDIAIKISAVFQNSELARLARRISIALLEDEFDPQELSTLISSDALSE